MTVSHLVKATREHDVELVQSHLPVVVRASSSSSNVGAAEFATAQVEQLDERVVGREVPAGLADLA